MSAINGVPAVQAPQASVIPEIAAFLDSVLPDEGLRCVARNEGSKWAHAFHARNSDAAAEIADRDAAGQQVYFGCATFRDDTGRKAANVASAKAFWADIDCGEGKPYADQSAGREALAAAVREIGLPSPLVVESGRGLHCYWPLDDAIDANAWRATADLLKRALDAANLKADPSRTADVASILRPPGTHNRKNPAQPLEVRLTQRGQSAPHQAILDAITCYLARRGHEHLDDSARHPLAFSGPVPEYVRTLATVSNSDLTAGVLASWFDRLTGEDKDACLAEMLAVPAVQDIADSQRGPWFKIVMACAQSGAPDAERLCREWSETSPRYDAKAFGRDWASARRDADFVSIGTIVHHAQKGGWDASRWRGAADGAEHSPDALSTPAMPFSGLDMGRYAVAPVSALVPPRPWLFGDYLIRGQYSMLAAPGGRGKSALTVAMALSAATGRDLLDVGFVKHAKVLLINAEDGREEIMRRLQAAAVHYSIADADIAGRLFVVAAGEAQSLTLNYVNTTTRQGQVNAAGFALLEEMVTQSGADIVVLDPLVALCPAGLNDNAVAATVMREVTAMAVRLRVAVLIVHHVRKGTAGQESGQEDAAGAAALVNLARVGLGIERLSEAEASKLGILPGDAWRHIALVNHKANLAPLRERKWLRLESVTLPNADPGAGYQYGDSVQVVVPFTPQTASSLFTAPMLRAVAVRIAQGCKEGTEPYAPTGKRSTPTNYQADVGRALAPFFPGQSADNLSELSRQAVAELIHQGIIVQKDAKRSGRNRGRGLMVKWDMSQWGADPAPGPHIAE